MTDLLRGTALAGSPSHDLLGAILSQSFRSDVGGEAGLRTLAFLEVLAETVEAKDATLSGHGRRVAHYARGLAERAGLGGDDRERVRLGAFLHDLGKVGVPSELIGREGALSAAERRVVAQHPSIGARLVQPLGLDRDLTAAILHHHEWWNGAGYPAGIAGRRIPFAARVVAIADSFDAMTSDRPYRAALPRDRALAELSRFAGIQFDPELTPVFVSMIEEDAALPKCAASLASRRVRASGASAARSRVSPGSLPRS